ncbi:MAG TPA: rhomboid family intramembrane serine protease [Xanthomonadaceae bacterium]|nr:rhomboid family intramembrane serine protease [Xanthomonadaceae bacterium]
MFVSIPERRRPRRTWVTPALVALCVLAFVWLSLLPPELRAPAVSRWGTVPETLLAARSDWVAAILEGRVLTLLTSLFIHADWLHLLGNALFLVIFGMAAERALGGFRFLLLFLAGGAVANLAAALSLDQPASVIVGSSGAVSAVIGAYLALFPRARLGLVLPLGLFLEFVRMPASLLIAIWALLQLAFSFVGPAFGAVAWWAHLTGFAGGVVFALLARRAVARRLRQRG